MRQCRARYDTTLVMAVSPIHVNATRHDAGGVVQIAAAEAGACCAKKITGKRPTQ
jgi:hypothetical protein